LHKIIRRAALVIPFDDKTIIGPNEGRQRRRVKLSESEVTDVLFGVVTTAPHAQQGPAISPQHSRQATRAREACREGIEDPNEGHAEDVWINQMHVRQS
jgi:hypothetical protein